MFCTNCGSQIQDDARFCVACGSPAQAPLPLAPPLPPVYVPPQKDVVTAMRLTLNRTEEQEKKLFKTVTVYYLHVDLEATPEEMALIKKHKWDEGLLFEHVLHHSGNVIEWKVRDIVGKPNRYGFASVNHLVYAENQLIENAKKLKQQLAAAAGFTSAGPREVNL